jgi:hypothetical protein
MDQFENGDVIEFNWVTGTSYHKRGAKVLSCTPIAENGWAQWPPASTSAEFERELSAEDLVHRSNGAAIGERLDAQFLDSALASWEGTQAIPVGDAQEVDFPDAGAGYYCRSARDCVFGSDSMRLHAFPLAVDPMCAAMSQPTSLIAKRNLADDLATRDFFERGPKPAEVTERAPERAKPPLAGFNIIHEGRWHV